jgi:membrane protein DedA with SNARE-associated domain
MNKIIDIIGEILWFGIFLTPLLTIPLVWRIKTINKILRIIIGLLLAAIISLIFYSISIDILFRNGMGPT